MTITIRLERVHAIIVVWLIVLNLSSDVLAGHPGPTWNDAESQPQTLKALAGDGDAAWGLFMSYTNRMSDNDRYRRLNGARAEYWLQVAVENQSRNAMAAVGMQKANSLDPCDLIRGVYLLDRATALYAKEYPGPYVRPPANQQGPGTMQNYIYYLKLEAQQAREKLKRFHNLDCTSRRWPPSSAMGLDH